MRLPKLLSKKLWFLISMVLYFPCVESLLILYLNDNHVTCQDNNFRFNMEKTLSDSKTKIIAWSIGIFQLMIITQPSNISKMSFLKLLSKKMWNFVLTLLYFPCIESFSILDFNDLNVKLQSQIMC